MCVCAKFERSQVIQTPIFNPLEEEPPKEVSPEEKSPEAELVQENKRNFIHRQ